MNRIWCYVRVSTREQATGGYSLQAQMDQCLLYASTLEGELGKATNCGVPGVFSDVKTARTNPLVEREGGYALCQNVQAGDHVIVVDYDRMFRSTLEFLQKCQAWKTAGISGHFINQGFRSDTASGWLMAVVCAAVAEWKSMIISERVKEGNALRAVTGRISTPARKQRPTELPGWIQQTVKTLAQQDQEQTRRAGTVRVYVRVSRSSQSVQQQVLSLERYLKGVVASDQEAVWYSDEGESAFRTPFKDRTAGGRLLKDLNEGDEIVIWRPDRAFRSIIDMGRVTEQLQEMGAVFHMAQSGLRSDTPAGRQMLQLMSLVAEWESAEIGRKVRAAFAAKRASGRPTFSRHNCLWSLDYVGDEDCFAVVPDPFRMEMLFKMQAWRDAGMTKNPIMRKAEVEFAAHERRPVLPACGVDAGVVLKRLREGKYKGFDVNDPVTSVFAEKLAAHYKEHKHTRAFYSPVPHNVTATLRTNMPYAHAWVHNLRRTGEVIPLSFISPP